MDSQTLLICLTLGCLMAVCSSSALAEKTTVLYNDQVIEVTETLADPNDLWVSPEDMTRINGFVLKPEGACLDEICILVDQSKDNDLTVKRGEKRWINLTAFARKLGQAFAVDHDANVWSFGEIPVTRQAFLDSAVAPDFALEDRDGKTIRLSDLRGKKVMIVTWASW